MDPKYIVIDTALYGPIMYIFPPMITHVKFNRMVNQKNEKILSAGFISRTYNGEGLNSCYGKSVSLDVKCNKKTDDILLNMLLNESYGAVM